MATRYDSIELEKATAGELPGVFTAATEHKAQRAELRAAERQAQRQQRRT